MKTLKSERCGVGTWVERTMGRRAALFLVVLLSGCAVWSADSQQAKVHLWDYDDDFKPALLGGSGDAEWAAALRWRARLNYDYSPWRGPAVAFANANTKGTLATDARAHSENMSADVGVGGAIQLQRADQLGTPPPLRERDANARETNAPPSGGFRWGRLELSGRIGVESDQSVQNAALTYGPQIGYFHNNEDGAWPLVPSMYVDLQQVDLLRSDHYRSLNLDDRDSSLRLSLIASWQLPVGTWLSKENRHVQALGAVVNLRYTFAEGTPDAIEERDEDRTMYIEAGLNYDLARLRVPWVRSAYVTVGHGRLPQVAEEQTQVFVGIAIGWDKPGSKRPHRFN